MFFFFFFFFFIATSMEDASENQAKDGNGDRKNLLLY